jgi:hypothetical protein
MKDYLISFSVGLLVGVLYYLLRMRGIHDVFSPLSKTATSRFDKLKALSPSKGTYLERLGDPSTSSG